MDSIKAKGKKLGRPFAAQSKKLKLSKKHQTSQGTVGQGRIKITNRQNNGCSDHYTSPVYSTDGVVICGMPCWSNHFLLVGAYVIVLIYIRGQWVEYQIPLHGNKKSWSGLYDIGVGRWIGVKL